MQEWCGQVYAQINNRDEFEVMSHSYFEGEADELFSLPTGWLENEIWTKIRIHPEDLPVGELEMIPSLEFLRTKHKPIQYYKANASVKIDGEQSMYTINYPALDRKLAITFSSTFPFEILGWTDTFKDGYGANAKPITSKASKIKTFKNTLLAAEFQ